MANYVYDNLGKEIVTTASDYAGGRDVMAQFKRPYLARGGTVLKEIWPPLNTTDYSPYLTDIKSINPPVTYDFMPGADAVRFIQQYSEFGLKEKMPLTGFTIIDSQTVSALGKAAVGVISGAHLHGHRRQSREQEVRGDLSSTGLTSRRISSRTTATSGRGWSARR